MWAVVSNNALAHAQQVACTLPGCAHILEVTKGAQYLLCLQVARQVASSQAACGEEGGSCKEGDWRQQACSEAASQAQTRHAHSPLPSRYPTACTSIPSTSLLVTGAAWAVLGIFPLWPAGHRSSLGCAWHFPPLACGSQELHGSSWASEPRRPAFFLICRGERR